MNRRNNYEIQAQQAISAFLKRNQEDLIKKNRLQADDDYLYTSLFSIPYRIHRRSGNFQRQEGEIWIDDNRFSPVMTLLDLLCDSSPNRQVVGKMQNMATFGHMFHTNLLESVENPTAKWIEQHQETFARNCLSLGGAPTKMGDLGFSLQVFQELKIELCFWASDEDFPASITWFWDQNALQYLHYETMYYAVDYLSELITKENEDESNS